VTSHRHFVGSALVAVVATVVLAAGCASSSDGGGSTTTSMVEAPAPGAALVAAVTDRLALAVDVARTKWSSGAPIEDLAREAQAVAAIEAAASDAGVDPVVAAAALRAQIEASKTVQRGLHAAWAAEGRGRSGEVRDLQDIRGELDEATAALLAALATVELPLPAARVEADAAAMRLRLADVPDPAPAIAQALAPFA
jgi:chorismate mutase